MHTYTTVHISIYTGGQCGAFCDDPHEETFALAHLNKLKPSDLAAGALLGEIIVPATVGSGLGCLVGCASRLPGHTTENESAGGSREDVRSLAVATVDVLCGLCVQVAWTHDRERKCRWVK